jgi:hypothetical protein
MKINKIFIAFLATLALVGWVAVAGAIPCDFYLTDSNLASPGTPPYAEVIVATDGSKAPSKSRQRILTILIKREST